MVWKETAWTAMSGEKSTAKMRPKLEPEPDSAFFAGAAAALAGAAFFAPPKDGKEMDGALKDGALKDGALKDGPFAASFFVFFSVTLTLVFSCWAANNSAAADLESPLATCATSTAAVAESGLAMTLRATTAAAAWSRAFARTTAVAPRALFRATVGVATETCTFWT